MLQLSERISSETACDHILYSGEQGLYMSLEKWKSVFRLDVSHWLELNRLGMLHLHGEVSQGSQVLAGQFLTGEGVWLNL